MSDKLFEFKAKVEELGTYENKLLTLKPKYIRLDHQIDTYFNAEYCRLKLRECNTENSLINYERKDVAGSKECQVIFYKHSPDKALKAILTKQLGIKVIVDKKRKIYCIDNVRFHFDEVENLGTFIEVEARDEHGGFSAEELKVQCDKYFDFFNLRDEDIIAQSYSDLTLALKG